MNYIKQVNQFYKLIQNNTLSTNAQCLYNYLLNKDSELGWLEEFTVSNLIICGVTNLSRQALDRARNELVSKGYIQYKKGHSNKAGRYVIVSFDTQSDTQSDTHDNTQNDTQSGHTVSTLNKLNKTKQNNKEKINKKEYGEFKNVKLTDEEYKKLQKMFPKDYAERIQTLDDYIQSKGHRYKDFVATLRNWARKDGYKFPEEQEKYKEITLTEQEYLKRGKKYE